MPVISVLRRQRQVDFHDCEVSLVYTMSLKPVKTLQTQGDLAKKKKFLYTYTCIYKLKLRCISILPVALKKKSSF